MAAAFKEKERQHADRLESQGKGVEGSVLDPLMAILVQAREREDVEGERDIPSRGCGRGREDRGRDLHGHPRAGEGEGRERVGERGERIEGERCEEDRVSE